MRSLYLALAAFLPLAACGSQSERAVQATNPYGPEAAIRGEPRTTTEAAPLNLASDAGTPPTNPGQQIAYSYGLMYTLPAASIAKAQSAHVALCDALGPDRCNIVSQVRNDVEGEFASGSLSLRVDAAQARAFADKMDAAVAGTGGQAAGRSLNAEDLSKQIIDVDARINAKQALAARLLELLKRRDAKVSDLVEAERAFAEVQEELDSARSTREEFSGRVQMSVVSAEYQAAGLSGRAGRRPVAEALASAGRTLGTSVASLIHFAVAAIPWAALLLLLMWASRRLLAWRRDKSNRKPEAAPD